MTTTAIADKLPSKPSDLIEMALADLIACEADPEVGIDMSVWLAHSPVTKKCYVCLAGAIMRQQRLVVPKADQWDSFSPDALEEISAHDARRLHWLEKLRKNLPGIGFTALFQRAWPTSWPTSPCPCDLPDYEDSPDKFKRGLREWIAFFRRHNL